jgi:hypothetical protein
MWAWSTRRDQISGTRSSVIPAMRASSSLAHALVSDAAAVRKRASSGAISVARHACTTTAAGWTTTETAAASNRGVELR